jgi:hypothetical protein
MWVNPKYAGPADPSRDQAPPPEPSGQLLASFDRPNRDRADEQLRVVLDQYEGHPFLSLRLWSRDDRSGAWWPVRGKGISVRLKEAEGVARALMEAVKRMEGQGGEQRPGPRRQRRAEEGRDSLPLQGIAGEKSGDSFDEFGA